MNEKVFERLSLTIPEDLQDWLHQFSRTIKRSGGYQLPNTMIIRACMRTIKDLKIENKIGAIKDDQKRGLANTEANAEMESVLVERMTAALRSLKVPSK